jgi:hypothetical protein
MVGSRESALRVGAETPPRSEGPGVARTPSPQASKKRKIKEEYRYLQLEPDHGAMGTGLPPKKRGGARRMVARAWPAASPVTIPHRNKKLTLPIDVKLDGGAGPVTARAGMGEADAAMFHRETSGSQPRDHYVYGLSTAAEVLIGTCTCAPGPALFPERLLV